VTDRERFAIDCRYVALVLGHPDMKAGVHACVGGTPINPDRAVCYQDDTVRIVVDSDSLAMLVTRLINHNPIVSRNAKGKTIRNHGEQALLFDTVRELAVEAATQVY
jgi:hypothetical protein